MNGNKVLILGNHDKISEDHNKFFNHITQIKNVKFKKSIYPFLQKDLEIVMCHFPMSSWEHIEKGNIMLHGHCHGKLDNFNRAFRNMFGSFIIDIGIDAKCGYYDLVSLEKLSNLVDKFHDEVEKKGKNQECNSK